MRTTADINKPIDETARPRVNMMFQQGDVSTRDQTDVLDFGIAPSVQVRHRHADGESPSRRCSSTTTTRWTMASRRSTASAADVPRNTAYGSPTTTPTPTEIMLGAPDRAQVQQGPRCCATRRNSTTSTRTCARPLLRVSAPSGRLARSHRFPTLAKPIRVCRLQNLFVRQQSHDRNIHDTSIYNQTELNAKFDTGFLRHNLLLGLESASKATTTSIARNGTCNGAPMQAATATSGYNGCTPLLQPNNSAPGYLVSTQGNVAAGQRPGLCGAYFNDTIEMGP